MTELYEKISSAVSYIRESGYDQMPGTSMIFGSGLGALATSMNVDLEIPYESIPGFCRSTLDFHEGRLLFGTISDVQVVAMDGRFHLYEGFDMLEVTFPVRVMRMLGAEKLLLSNISGGLNPDFRAGDLVIISDHINLMGDNPLIGENDERLGPRFPDMAEPYSQRLINLAERHSMKNGLRVARGVYSAMTGPCFETRAEYRMLRTLGADMIGMSSVPEVIVGVHGGMEIFGISLISDECFPECLEPIDIELLLSRAQTGSQQIGAIINGMLSDAEYLVNKKHN